MSFQFILLGEYQLNFDLNFKRALPDIRTEEGYYVLESLCQNFEVVSCVAEFANIYMVFIVRIQMSD